MKPPPSLARTLAALALLAGAWSAPHAQMGTPSPSGPPSTQPAPKSPSQPSSGESVKDGGGPQITVPLKRTRPAPPAEAPSSAESQSAKGKG